MLDQKHALGQRDLVPGLRLLLQNLTTLEYALATRVLGALGRGQC
jgi:hypothetical protein